MIVALMKYLCKNDTKTFADISGSYLIFNVCTVSALGDLSSSYYH